MPAEKPPATKPDAAPETDRSEPGRFGLDERGNVTWQWADDANLQADGTLGVAERLRALDPGLDVVEEKPAPGPVPVNPKGLKTGYNPYDSGALVKDSWKKKKDLRQLSKWIETRRKMEGKKK
jgi:hypothetical protein